MTRSLLTNVFVKEPPSSSTMSMNSKGTHFLLASTSAITQEKLDKWRQDFYSEPKNVLAQNVCSRFDPFDVCLSRKCLETTNHVFTHKVSRPLTTSCHLSIETNCFLFEMQVEMEGKPVTNQRSSGRCWLFAALNCLRLPLMKEYNLDEFEFSQAYLFYWDKIERCNYFLNNIVKTSKRGEKVDGRLVSFLLNVIEMECFFHRVQIENY